KCNWIIGSHFGFYHCFHGSIAVVRPKRSQLGLSWLVWLLFLMPIVSVIFLAYKQSLQPVHKKVIGTVPAFRAMDNTENPITESDLLGKIWVASFVYAGCGSQCDEQLEWLKQ